VCAIQPKVKLKFSHSCIFFKEPLPQCVIYLHWVKIVSHPPYKPVCLPCFHYWLCKSYKYMVGVACICINNVTVSWFNSWQNGVPTHIQCLYCKLFTLCCVNAGHPTLQVWYVSLTNSLPSILYFSNDNESRIRMDMRSVNSSVCSNTKSSLCKNTTKSTLLTHKQALR
jgi:hypothetical protein